MSYEWRIMSMSEHTDTSWEDLFGCDDVVRRNYCVFNKDTLRVVDDCLTLAEAKEQAAYWTDVEEQVQAEYDLDN